MLKSFTKAEVNFLLLPYFCLDKKADPSRDIEFKEMQRRGNEIFETIWTVLPHPSFGLPKDFERRLQRAVEYSLSLLPRPISNPVQLPCFRELARIMGVRCPGKFVHRVKQGFTTMMKTIIMSRRSYYDKSKKAWIEAEFHLYDKVVFKGERLSDGRTADRNYAYFNSLYLDNINSLYVRPLDLEYLKSLKPISARLYELLGVKFYGHHKYIQYKYSTLCKLLPIRRHRTLSRSRQQFEGAHNELKQTLFFSQCEWIPIPGIKNDWYVRYVPGKRFFKEKETTKRTMAADDNTVRIPLIDTISDESNFSVGIDMREPDPNNNYFSSLNRHETDSLWSLFFRIVKKYPEFDIRAEDREWFRDRIQESSNCLSIDLMYEIQNWGDWLELEHRKKSKKEQNRFPRLNYKGSLLNWLQYSLRAAGKGEIHVSASIIQNKPGRKGFDLPSDYPIDFM